MELNRTKLTGMIVHLSVGDVYFPTENAFQKFWNAQSDDVKRNLTPVDNPQTEHASTTGSTNTSSGQDSRSDN